MDNTATIKFITDARAIYGDAYDYKLVEYKNSKTKIVIICPIHGKFEKQPNKHLSSKQGCPTCGESRGRMKRTQGKDEFIAKAKALHGDMYDYEKVEYLNNHTKVIIRCPEHGEFEQIPNSHLNGRGCPICAGNVPLNSAVFVERAVAIHGNKFNYSQVIYKSGKSNVRILCPEHGEFQQLPEVHLRGNGCSKCSGTAKLTTESFIEQSRQVHGGKYDYSLVKYSGNKGKVKILCPQHGLFEQQAKAHLRRGDGCIFCAGKAAVTKSDFIKRAIATHGEKYDYSAMEYVDFSTDIEIKCQAHGKFVQNPKSHAGGYGCPACGVALRGEMRRNTTDDFLAAAVIVHGDTYDYSKSIYGGDNKSKLTIICRKHGEFKQSPNQHLRGSGCSKCKLPSDNDAIYIWKAIGQFFNGVQLYKIGVTSSRLEDKRIKLVAKKIRMEFEIITLRAVPGSAQYLESRLLTAGLDPQFMGFDGATEFRALTDETLAENIAAIQDYIETVDYVIEQS
jgi:Protein of unknown function (DUF723)